MVSAQQRYFLIPNNAGRTQLEISIQPVEFLEILDLACPGIRRIISIEKSGGTNILENIEMADCRIDMPVWGECATKLQTKI